MKILCLDLANLCYSSISSTNLIQWDLKRSEATYMVLLILKNELLGVTNDIYLAHQLLNCRDFLKYKGEAKLKKYQKYWYQSVNTKQIKDFKEFEQVNIFNDIDDLENYIKNAINNENFSFTPIWYQGDDIYSPKEIEIIKNQIVRLYNFIIASGILEKDQLLRLVYNFNNNETLKADGDIYGQTLSSRNCQCMIFKHNWYNNSVLKQNYEIGYMSTGHPFHIFVHEFGHAIKHFWSLNAEDKANLNIKIKKSNNESALKIIQDNQTNFNDVFSYYRQNLIMINEKTCNYLYKKFENNISTGINNNYLKFVEWIAVPSAYARKVITSTSPTKKIIDPKTEWFAEAFAWYYLQPKHVKPKLNKPWGWWHQLFTKELPEEFNS